MRLKARCMKCGHSVNTVRLSAYKGLTVHTCPNCDRVVVVGHSIIAGDMFEARMRAQGYERIR